MFEECSDICFSLKGVLVHAEDVLHSAGFVDKASGGLADRRSRKFGGIAGSFCFDSDLVDCGAVGCVAGLANGASQLCVLLLGEVAQRQGRFDGRQIVRRLLESPDEIKISCALQLVQQDFLGIDPLCFQLGDER